MTRHTQECPGHSAQAQLCPARGSRLCCAWDGSAALQERGGLLLGGPCVCGASWGRAASSRSSQRDPRAQLSLTFRVMSSKLNSKNGSVDFFFFLKKKQTGESMLAPFG